MEVTSRRLPTGELIVRKASMFPFVPLFIIHILSNVNHLTENIILSSGGSPRIPRVLSSLIPSEKGWTPSGVSSIPLLHTANYCTVIGPLLASLSSAAIARGRPLKIAVVGGGQSSAECLLNVYSRIESLGWAGESQAQHEVDMIIRKGSLKPSDDSPFVNEIFDPASTSSFYAINLTII